MTLFRLINYISELEAIGCKRLSKNDVSWAHPGGSHQNGVFIPKIFIDRNVFPVPPIDSDGEIPDEEGVSLPIHIKWIQKDSSFLDYNSKFFYYPSKTEFRITRLPKVIFSNLNFGDKNYFLIGRVENTKNLNLHFQKSKITNWLREDSKLEKKPQESFFYAEIITPQSEGYKEFLDYFFGAKNEEQGFVISIDFISF